MRYLSWSIHDASLPPAKPALTGVLLYLRIYEEQILTNYVDVYNFDSTPVGLLIKGRYAHSDVSRADDRLAAVTPAYLFIYAPFAAADRPTLIVSHYRG